MERTRAKHGIGRRDPQTVPAWPGCVTPMLELMTPTEIPFQASIVAVGARTGSFRSSGPIYGARATPSRCAGQEKVHSDWLRRQLSRKFQHEERDCAELSSWAWPSGVLRLVSRCRGEFDRQSTPGVPMFKLYTWGYPTDAVRYV